MWFAIKRLSLGIILIGVASGILLYSDRGRRNLGDQRAAHESAGDDSSKRRVGLLQYSSTPLYEDSLEGLLEGLKEKGFVQDENLDVRLYKAEGDMPTANIIAKELVSRDFDLVITLGTPAMQAVATANVAGNVVQVFGTVANPYVSGVGCIEGPPQVHPPHLTGVGSFMPVDLVFRVARQCYPALKKVGVAWNAAEANSEAFTKKAREICKELKIELIEASVDNSSGVKEAVDSLAGRGAEAIWVGGDNAVNQAMDAVVGSARQAGIPVFTIVPGVPTRGTLIDLGANFFEVGRETGRMAGRILSGEKAADIPVENYVPRNLLINKTALKGLRAPWTLPQSVLDEADILVDEQGVHKREKPIEEAAPAPAETPVAQAKPLSKKWNLHFVQYVEIVDVEETEHGVRDGLKESGLVEGRDYQIKKANAQGDMATMNSLIDSALTDGADMLITFSTPTLQAALQKARNIPIVFTFLANPVVAGAGKSDTDHLPNVTGFYSSGAYDEMMKLVRECLPKARKLGALFVPTEVNTVFHKDRMAETAKKAGMELIALPVSTSSEVSDAALALCQEKLDAICQSPGNLTATSFVSIARAARDARLPIFAFMTTQVQQGAALGIVRDYYDDGRAAAHLAARVMRGENPAKIPFETSTEVKLLHNPEAAKACGLKVPDSVLKRVKVTVKTDAKK